MRSGAEGIVISEGSRGNISASVIDVAGAASAYITGARVASNGGNKGDGINLSFDSTLMLIGAPIDLVGNVGWGLYCHDAESSVNDMGMAAGTVSPTCTGFD